MKLVAKLSALTASLVVTASIFLVAAPSASAVSCSGNGCNGKDPIYTGCNQNAYLAKEYIMTDRRGIAIAQKVQVYYSRSCGTNWIRVTGNPYGGATYKMIQSLNSNGTPRFTETEIDYGTGASYSMMVYAPGSTPVQFYGKVFDKAGNAQAWSSIITLR